MREFESDWEIAFDHASRMLPYVVRNSNIVLARFRDEDDAKLFVGKSIEKHSAMRAAS